MFFKTSPSQLTIMKKIKKFIFEFPEVYFLAVLLVAAFKPPFTISPVLMAVACIFIFQMLVMNGLLGMIIANVFLILNSFLLVALISELGEFEVFNNEAYQLLIGGSVFWFSNLYFSILMIRKYMEGNKKKTIVNQS